MNERRTRATTASYGFDFLSFDQSQVNYEESLLEARHLRTNGLTLEKAAKLIL